MTSMHVAVSAAMLALVASGCAPADPGEEEGDVGSVAQPVINGTDVDAADNPGVAALFHQTSRPCSATRIDREGWYLTAAHCLNDLNYNPLPPSGLSLTDRIDAGLRPPPDARPVQQTIRHPDPLVDLALVFAPGGGPVTNLPALWLAPPGDLIGQGLRCYGYGRFVETPDETVDTGTSGAGWLRMATLTMTSASPGLYTVSSNGAGQILGHGDSGGPCFTNRFFIINSFPLLKLYNFNFQTGVHRSSDLATWSRDVTVQEYAGWISENIGWLYIKRMTKNGPLYLDVQSSNPASGTPVWSWGLNDSSAQHWRYDYAARRIRNENGKCLALLWDSPANGTPVGMRDCDGGPAQQWTFTSTLAIQNANGKCLDVPNNDPVEGVPLQIYDCNDSFAQRWVAGGAP
jgi:ricin-type beta-trefoil lectin protein